MLSILQDLHMRKATNELPQKVDNRNCCEHQHLVHHPLLHVAQEHKVLGSGGRILPPGVSSASRVQHAKAEVCRAPR
jgi:hypothetical protein